ncbi:mechanosensitive ion channel family protein [Arenibacter latericius]|uniref:mechanosensitive ion channel family protein n=1 Tax=Arenibacter latericius TaxID=86104 RepID=UPI000479D8AF|nr:mechanosensitive ion channel domain-containing protein [Arenibacter latericius]
MVENFKDLVLEYLLKLGMTETVAAYINLILLLVILLFIAALLDFFIWKILRGFSVRIARQTKTNFDNYLVAHKVPRFLARVIPLMMLVEFVPLIFSDFPFWESFMEKLLRVSVVVLTLIIVKSIFRSINDHLKTLSRFKDKPVDSYIQVFIIFAWLMGILTIFAIITETTVWAYFTALGAASAVILLIFKDSILGFVASIQVSINDMVRIGDWITFQKYGADGDVTEITLATVKVQNFDKTITTIPTYALISDSFKNWRGMETSGGRRIKRSLAICQKSIRFLTEEDLKVLRKIQLIEPYIEKREKEIDDFNQKHQFNREVPVNGRNMTNFGVFREYTTQYLKNHPGVNQKMTLMVRQLSPTPQGIPLEIYAFSSDKRWAIYENVMSDIFDHLLASISYFDLKIFEYPTTYITNPNPEQQDSSIQ